ncbi:MAG TPA: ankyrin repeat domain-containing protein [Bryobacteraceae bacterium]|nr:ankyrin repeat domain-containing protein [Bryobacteraceae bacterium]
MVDLKRLPFRADLADYEKQAEDLLAGYQEGDPTAIRQVQRHHPRFRDPQVAWLPRDAPDSEVLSAGLDLADMQLAIARWYDFRDWQALAEYAAAVTREDSPVRWFESAVEAVIEGDVESLRQWLREHPELAVARSTRVCPFDPPVHRATLLHYVAANGVEGYRQKTPANAVDVAETLLQAGAEPDALADMYGGKCTTMSMLVSSSPPAQAGVQVALVETLLGAGARVEPHGSGSWTSPLMTALAFGFQDAAEALVRHGARVDYIAAAAGLGRIERVRELLPASDAEGRHRALALAAQHGHTEVVGLLLDAGEDPNRYNPEGNHAHSTPLHQAALGGHLDVVRLLLERGARLDTKDTAFHGTPEGWAIYAGRTDIAEYLKAQGAAPAQSTRQ